MKKKITYKKLYELSLSLSITKNELLELGLVKTYHAIDEATKAIGWEMSKVMQNSHPLIELEDMDSEE